MNLRFVSRQKLKTTAKAECSSISQSGFYQLIPFLFLLRPCFILLLGSREPYGLRPKEKMSESGFNELYFYVLFKDKKYQKSFLLILPQFKNG